jgi:hypothetical protein
VRVISAYAGVYVLTLLGLSTRGLSTSVFGLLSANGTSQWDLGRMSFACFGELSMFCVLP